MKAMVLAAGKGERMRPLTEQTPKALLRVGGRTLIEHQILRLASAGHREIIVNHARFGEQIEAALGNGKQLGVSLQYSPEGTEPLETGGGILQALPLLGSDPFIVVNADIWIDYPLHSLPRHFNGLAHLVLVSNPSHHPEGDFALQEGHLCLEGPGRLTFSGLGVYRPELFDECRPGRFPLAAVIRIAASRGLVFGEHYRGRWLDIGTPQRLAEAEQFVVSD